jgi:DNA-directed RNA polymerase subunit M/transcription elongation factor TFIIS
MLNNFDQEYFLYANDSLKLDYLTQDIKNVDKKKLLNLSKEVNRDRHIYELSSLLQDFVIAAKLEAGIFEYSIIYAERRNILKNIIPSIYKDKFMDVYNNLNKKSSIYNHNLTKMIFTEQINPQRVAALSPQEINKSLWEYAIRKKNLREDKKRNIATTDLYLCFKCGERKCQVTEMQTRSADEPITKFITCLVCENVFKK